MKLYRVIAEFEFFVKAEDEIDAIRKAEVNGSQAFSDDSEADYVAIEITDLRDVPKVWRDGYPYGDGPEVTCEQMLVTGNSAGVVE